MNYDALLLVSFGGPEGTDDVIPFLERVLKGRRVPRERMKEVAEHYHHFGGVSPINGQNRALISALEEALEGRDLSLPVYWGNRNWHPLLSDTVGRMAADGIQRRWPLSRLRTAPGRTAGSIWRTSRKPGATRGPPHR